MPIVLEGPWQVSNNSQKQRKQKVIGAHRLAGLVVAAESLLGYIRLFHVTWNLYIEQINRVEPSGI